MSRENNDIREAAKKAGVNLWQVAEKLHMQDYTFSRKLRHELTEAEKEKIINIIKELEKGAI